MKYWLVIWEHEETCFEITPRNLQQHRSVEKSKGITDYFKTPEFEEKKYLQVNAKIKP